MQGSCRKQDDGFTLIETMVVVAIIGILASVAFAQYASYRNRAFNASAESALYTARLAEAGLYSDYKLYGGTVQASGTAGSAAGELLTQSGYVATTTANQQQAVTLSNHVRLQARTSAAFDAATITVKHDNGDRFYVVETDVPGIYYRIATVGTPMVAGDAVAATKDKGHPDAAAAGYKLQ